MDFPTFDSSKYNDKTNINRLFLLINVTIFKEELAQLPHDNDRLFKQKIVVLDYKLYNPNDNKVYW